MALAAPLPSRTTNVTSTTRKPFSGRSARESVLLDCAVRGNGRLAPAVACFCSYFAQTGQKVKIKSVAKRNWLLRVPSPKGNWPWRLVEPL